MATHTRIDDSLPVDSAARDAPEAHEADEIFARLTERPAELLRFATAGSVDDGKSTLIGRLLYDSKQVLVDQLEHVEQTSRQMGHDFLDLSLLTDGLRAEREQGITIDVAYRYFATAQRRFIIADTPGHEQYTRNMVTGASTADLVIVLVDARKGVVAQSRRHAFIASLLAIPHLVVCVNKMDTLGYDQEVFDGIVDEFERFAARLDIQDVTFVPISALNGDNVVERSANMPWYQGPPLLYHLEHVHIASDRNLIDVRLPVQWVIRPRASAGVGLGAGSAAPGAPAASDYRAYAGQMAGGVLREGDEVVVLPGGRRTTIAGIDTLDGPVREAFPPMSVAVRLADEVDAGRGSTIARPHNQPTVGSAVESLLCWMSERPLDPQRRYAVKHTTRTAPVGALEVRYRIDVDTLHRDETADTLALNDLGRVRIELAAPLVYDSYRRNRTMGSLIVIDEATNETVAAGTILDAETESGERTAGVDGAVAGMTCVDAATSGGAGAATTADPAAKTERSPNVRWEQATITRDERWRALGLRGATIWLTGLPAAGKSTIGRAIEERLVKAGRPAYLLDGDNLRHGLNGDLGFDEQARAENVRRTAHVARLLAECGAVALVSLVSPYAADRELAAELHAEQELAFLEVFVSTPLAQCERRDPKGLYARARAGELAGMTGVDAPYEPPAAPDVVVGEGGEAIEAAVDRVLEALAARGVHPR
ncbi:MAG TPA: adenylyl-sulfate kinase [Solirubrobacteraceae bacterium]|jgi:bifunctional enzyme CysN/CysC|nr:adenylyl-sulfate kinase [Solirubrobacteraceae bacterium]